ncbi:MAG TPA: hypothetical protein VNS49_04225, partial [Streptomyces sp.]|nr:hypothetical protein [Streptomyces sp.]
TVLTAAADGVPALLKAVRDPAADTLRAARAQLKAYLLGPDEPPSTVRFDKAVQDLRVEAETHRARCGAQQPAGADGHMDGPVTSASASLSASPSAVAAAAAAAEEPQLEEAGSRPAPADQLLADALGDEEAL